VGTARAPGKTGGDGRITDRFHLSFKRFFLIHSSIFMMNISLRQLRALVALARTGSFTQAAGALHVTQSALSGLIKELEQNLGVRLVDRNTRSAELTAVGRGFVPLGQKILQDLDGALASGDDPKAPRTGGLRLAAPPLMACTLPPDAIAAYRAQDPAGPGRPAGPLFDMPFMVVFPRGHALEKLPRIRWEDAMAYPFIALQGQFTERLALDLHVAPQHLTLHPSNEVSFMTTALSMVSAGLGVTACLPYAVSLVRLHQLQIRPLHEPELRRKFQVYRRAQVSLSPAAEQFMAFLLRYVAAHGWGEAAP